MKDAHPLLQELPGNNYLSPQQRTQMVAGLLATIALRVVKQEQQQESYEQEQSL